MKTGQINVEVQPTYRVEQKLYINGDTPIDDELAFEYAGKLTLYFDDNLEPTNKEVARDATNKPTT